MLRIYLSMSNILLEVHGNSLIVQAIIAPVEYAACYPTGTFLFPGVRSNFVLIRRLS